MTAHAAVGIHDDLSSRQPGIAHGTAENESSRGIDVVLGVGVEHVRGDNLLNNMLQHFGPQLLVVHFLGMLRGDNNCVHPHRLMILIVFDRDL